MYYTIELLRALEAVHATGVIHCQLVPGNVALRSGGDGDDWDPVWNATGAKGWSEQGSLGPSSSTRASQSQFHGQTRRMLWRGLLHTAFLTVIFTLTLKSGFALTAWEIVTTGWYLTLGDARHMHIPTFTYTHAHLFTHAHTHTHTHTHTARITAIRLGITHTYTHTHTHTHMYVCAHTCAFLVRPTRHSVDELWLGPACRPAWRRRNAACRRAGGDAGVPYLALRGTFDHAHVCRPYLAM